MSRIHRADGIEPLEAPAGVVAVAVRGLLTFPRLSAALAVLDRLLEVESDATSVVIDLSRIDAFEPGVPARLFHWLNGHSPRVSACALVTLSPVLHATARAALLLLPKTSLHSCHTLSEAYARISEATGSRERTSTGLRGRTSAVVPSIRKNVG